MPSSHQDLPVVLHNEKRGLLTVEEGKLDVLQLSKEGHRKLRSLPHRSWQVYLGRG